MQITPQNRNPAIPTEPTYTSPTELSELEQLSDAARSHHASTAAASSSVEAAAPASIPSGLNLSPEALMAYCQSRLNSLDSQMNGIFSSQETNEKVTNDVNQVASAFGQLPGADGGSPSMIAVSPANHSAIDLAYTQAIADAGGPKTQLGSELAGQMNSFDNGIQNGSIRADVVSDHTENLKNYASSLNSNSELSMINLQSLMSQRQTAVQLTTNLVQSLGDQSNAIAKNVGG